MHRDMKSRAAWMLVGDARVAVEDKRLHTFAGVRDPHQLGRTHLVACNDGESSGMLTHPESDILGGQALELHVGDIAADLGFDECEEPVVVSQGRLQIRSSYPGR